MRFTPFTGPENPVKHVKSAKVAKSTRVCPPTGPSSGTEYTTLIGHTPKLGTEKVPQKNCVTKILPNVRVNFLVRFASKTFVLLGNDR